jgi:hypothetical protein
MQAGAVPRNRMTEVDVVVMVVVVVVRGTGAVEKSVTVSVLD